MPSSNLKSCLRESMHPIPDGGKTGLLYSFIIHHIYDDTFP